MKIVETYKKSFFLTDHEFFSSLPFWKEGKASFIERLNTLIPANFVYAGEVDFLAGKDVYTDGKRFFYVDDAYNVKSFDETSGSWCDFKLLIDSGDGLEKTIKQAKNNDLVSIGAIQIDKYLSKNIMSKQLLQKTQKMLES